MSIVSVKIGNEVKTMDLSSKTVRSGTFFVAKDAPLDAIVECSCAKPIALSEDLSSATCEHPAEKIQMNYELTVKEGFTRKVHVNATKQVPVYSHKTDSKVYR